MCDSLIFSRVCEAACVVCVCIACIGFNLCCVFFLGFICFWVYGNLVNLGVLLHGFFKINLVGF